MNRGNWVPINRGFVSALPRCGREYTELEAAFCLTCDLFDEKEVSQNGYAELWGWSRGRVSRFAKRTGWSISKRKPRGLNRIKVDRDARGVVIHERGDFKNIAGGQPTIQPADNRRYNRRTTDDTTGGQPVGQYNSNLQCETGNRRTTDDTTGGQPTIQPTDNRRDTTIYNNKDTNIYISTSSSLNTMKESCDRGEVVEMETGDFYITKRKRKLKEWKLVKFELFWNKFNYKVGKADAADAWLDIPNLTEDLADEICLAAESEAAGRSSLVSAGRTPKMAQGWLSGRRWEDTHKTAEILQHQGSGCHNGMRNFAALKARKLSEIVLERADEFI